jgi:hypothetical protein
VSEFEKFADEILAGDYVDHTHPHLSISGQLATAL